MDVFIFLPLDYTNVAGLPSDDVQYWKYVINRSSGITVL